MRRNHYIALFVVLFIFWTIILYYLFLHKPRANIDFEDHEIMRPNIGKLETNLKTELEKTDFLINSLKYMLKQQKFVKQHNIDLPDKNGIISQNINKTKTNDVIYNHENFELKTKAAVVNNLEGKQQDPISNHSISAIAILLFSCNRITISRCLDQLIRYRPSKERFPIIVSQDCDHEPTAEVIKSFGNEIHHVQQPDQSDIFVPLKEKKFKGYFKIARHYGWALNKTFVDYNFNAVVIVEDDLDISSDFYEYFEATFPILNSDSTLWCVSAWNDNGKPALVDLNNGSDLLYRTDFFPGLGWMLTKKLWIEELMIKWPKSYWDDWIREPEQRKDRACIRPELSRTKTFGKIGVSNGLFYEKHLKYMHLNYKHVEFTKKNLTYLLKDNYDKNFLQIVYGSPIVSYEQLKLGGKFSNDGPVRIVYGSKNTFKSLSKLLGLMDDFKSGVPRTAYLGIVSFIYKNRRVFLAPNTGWSGYNS